MNHLLPFSDWREKRSGRNELDKSRMLRRLSPAVLRLASTRGMARYNLSSKDLGVGGNSHPQTRLYEQLLSKSCGIEIY